MKRRPGKALLATSSVLIVIIVVIPYVEAGQIDAFDDGKKAKAFSFTTGRSKAYANLSIPAAGLVISANIWLEPSPWTDQGKVDHDGGSFGLNKTSSSNVLIGPEGISLQQRHEGLQFPSTTGTGWENGNFSLETTGLEELGNGSLTLAPAPSPGFVKDIVVDSSINAQDYPDMVVDKYGTAHAVWQDNRRFWGVYYSKTLPDGTFMPAVKVDDQLDLITQNQPCIAVDGKGGIHVLFQDFRDDNPDIYYARSSNGGQDWSANMRVDQDNTTGKNGSRQETPSVAIDGNDMLHVAWKDNRDGNWTLIYTTFASSGFAPGPEINVTYASGNQTDPVMTVAPDGRVHIFWRDDRSGKSRIYHARLNDTKDGFIDEAPVDPNMTDGDQYWPDAAFDKDGRLYVVWNDNSQGGFRIYCARSDDGRTFGPKVAVTTEMVWSYGPSVSVDPKGTVHVAWYDYRYGDGDIIYANSTDRAGHFPYNTLVNDPTENVTHRNPVVGASPDGTAQIVWVDLRGGNADIFYSRSTLGFEGYGSVLISKDLGRESTSLDRFSASYGLEEGQANVTNISFEMCTSDDNMTWGAWTSLTPGPITALSGIDPGRYIRLRAMLSTVKNAYRPHLTSMALEITVYETGGMYRAMAVSKIDHLVTDLEVGITADYLNGTADPLSWTVFEMSFNHGDTWEAIPINMPTFMNEHVDSMDYRITLSSNGSGTPLIERVTIKFGMKSSPSGVGFEIGDSTFWCGMGEMTETFKIEHLEDSLNSYIESRRTGDEGPDDMISVPIVISSTMPGTVTVTKMLIDCVLPPVIEGVVPPFLKLTIDEGHGGEFMVTAVDQDDRPLNYTWFMDGILVQGIDAPIYEPYFDFNSSGPHTVTARVSNGYLNVTREWAIEVFNVNRPPVITSVSPTQVVLAKEEDIVSFDVTAYDPDGETLTYVWTYDGIELEGQEWNYRDLIFVEGTAGDHILNLEVSDGHASIFHNWTVKVEGPSKSDDAKGYTTALALGLMVLIIVLAVIVMEMYTSHQRRARMRERTQRHMDSGHGEGTEDDRKEDGHEDDGEEAEEEPVKSKPKKKARKRVRKARKE